MKRLLLSIIAVSITAGMLIAAAGCAGSMARSRAEREIAALLPRYLGPAERYEVKVDGSAGQLMRGKLRNLHIVGTNVVPKDLPRMAKLEANVQDLHLDMDTKAVVSSGPAVWTGDIAGAELSRLLAGKVPHVSNLRVSVKDKVISAYGAASYMGVDAVAVIEARPEARNGRQIWLNPSKVETMGLTVPLPNWGLSSVSRFVNPVYVIEPGPLDVRIEKLETVGGALRAHGTFDPKGLASAASAAQRNQPYQ